MTAAASAPLLLVALAAPLARALGAPAVLATAVVDVVEALVPAAAAVASAAHAVALWRHRRARSAARWEVPGWGVVALACASWSAGQVAWAAYELLLHRDAPQLSLADAGYLGFAVLAPAGTFLLARRTARTISPVRAALDGVIVAGALLLAAWVLLLRDAVAAGSSSPASLVVNVAYPVSDVVLLAVALTTVTRARADAPRLLLAGGAALMALADTAYAYLGSSGLFSTGGLLDLGWTGAFVLLAAAPLAARRPAPGPRRATRPGYAAVVLPYLPALVAIGLVVAQVPHETLDTLTLGGAAALVAVVLARQGLVLADNVALTRDLHDRTAQLASLAYTDPLTGVANRTAFTAALEEALADRRPVVAAFCDLDRFKAVNDVAGHGVGDALLVAVAARLGQVTRGTDVVARLGGDEFAVLVLDPDAPAAAGAEDGAQRLRDRLATALSVPLALDPALADAAADPATAAVLDAVSVSIGVVASAELGAPDAEQLLRVADHRMYSMKRTRAAAAARVRPSSASPAG